MTTMSELKIEELRKGLSGIFRNTYDGGESWEYRKVKEPGFPVKITESEYLRLKCESLEAKSHTPATKRYGNVYGFYVNFQ